MGTSLACTTKLQEFARIVSSHKHQKPKQVKPTSRVSSKEAVRVRPSGIQADSGRVNNQKKMDSWGGRDRVPLAEVVSDLVKAWFKDALEAAQGGDSAMQILVGQMYCSGYGVPRDVQKGHAWISKASESRSSAWKVGDKHPGYNVSDSDSDELKDDSK